MRVYLVLGASDAALGASNASPSAKGRLPECLHFAESEVMLGVVRGRSVHKFRYGHNFGWAA